MSMDEARRLAGCVGKTAFPSHSAASAVANKRQRRKKRDRQRSEPYRCEHCRHWHIGGGIR
jgi:hypothetical protein